MSALARLSLFLVVILVVVSAYLRLHEAGIGCPDWPACYGAIGAPPVENPDLASSAYQRIIEESDAPLAWAAPLHRLVASVLGLCVFFLAMLSLRAKRHRLLCFALVGLTMFLALIGLRSGSLHNQAIVLGNLVGGFSMLGLLGWMVFSESSDRKHSASPPASGLHVLAMVTLVALVLQIIIGGFTSANFAALSCGGLPDCNGSWLPGPGLGDALNLERNIEINEAGVAMGGPERAAIHALHRMGSLLALVLALACGAWAAKTPAVRTNGLWVLGLSLAVFGIGLGSVLTDLPIFLAVAHNWLAALMLLSVIRLLAFTRSTQASPAP